MVVAVLSSLIGMVELVCAICIRGWRKDGTMFSYLSALFFFFILTI